MNYKLSLSYHGANFHGWNIQPAIRTVQGELFDVVYNLFEIRPVINASGRTDAGVHAIEQIINISHPQLNLAPLVLWKALESRLPDDLHINDVCVIPESFHARFSAKTKTYVYLINTKATYDVINYQTIYQYNKYLDIKTLSAVKSYFEGTHNFLSFSTTDLENTTRTICAIEISEQVGLIKIAINGNGFLRSMVRMIVGTLIAYCEQKIDLITIEDCLNNPQKGKIKFKAPACGLYLMKVYY